VPDAKPLRLSEEIDRLVAAFAKRPVRLREILEITRGRGYTLLLTLLALPFCTPIPLPGLSTPFGVVIALIGFRLSLREKPWLPERLLDTELPPKFFPGFLSATRRLVRGMEFFLRPRWTRLLDAGALHHAYGAIIIAPASIYIDGVISAHAGIQEFRGYQVSGSGFVRNSIAVFNCRSNNRSNFLLKMHFLRR